MGSIVSPKKRFVKTLIPSTSERLDLYGKEPCVKFFPVKP